MTFEAVLSDLKTHEDKSQARFEELRTTIEGKTMSEPVSVKNIFDGNPAASMIPLLTGGMGNTGAAMGGGLGAGLLGGVLGGVLLNRGGLLGQDGAGGGVVTPALLASSLAQVTDTQNNTTVMQSLGDIKASIPLAEGQVQLALAGTQASLTSQATMNQLGLLAGQASITKSVSDAIASSLASQNNLNVNILNSAAATKESIAAFGVANLTATQNAQTAVTASINASTKEIISALNDQNVANLQRQLTVAEQALLERNAVLRSRETEINITNTNTANAQQMQTQNQQQQQFQILANLAATVSNLANDIQVVRQGQVTFNSGTMVGSGTQSAANTKVN